MADPYKRGFLDAIWMPQRSGQDRALFNRRKLQLDVYFDSVRRAKMKQDAGDFAGDVNVWTNTIQHASDPLQGFLKRLFTILKWGPLLYRKNANERGFQLWSHSLATALSHGGRVLIQLPRGDQRQRTGDGAGQALAQMVWSWLLGGVTPKERSAATHGIDELLGKPAQACKNPPRQKWLLETGLVAAGGLQHWGVNIALGGENRTSHFAILYDIPEAKKESDHVLLRQSLKARADGRHGHVYLGYKRAVGKGHGGILVGVEGSEPGKWDVLGHFHGPSGTSSYMSMVGGIKFKHLDNADVPKGKDCMFVDLASPTSWENFLLHRDGFAVDDLGQPPPQ